MTSPSSLGPATLLTKPTQSWETQGDFPVAEGPAALYHGGKTYIAYSGSQCWSPSYQLGLLTYKGSGDPTNANSWTKSGPVFSSANGNYGTGHNGYAFCYESCRMKHANKSELFRFFTSPDGKEIWNVYHATSNPAGACDGNRYTAAQKVNWNADGTPNFGQAVKPGQTITGPSGEPA